MKRRHGFTLFELMVAIVIAGIVALLVYGTAALAIDTENRIRDQQFALQSAQAMRATVHDALRNARPARVPRDTAFFIEDRVTADGRPNDRLSFVAAGGLPPLTADTDWRVTVEPSDAGLVLVATPIGVVAPPRIVIGYPGVTGINIRVQELTRDRAWTDRWRFPAYVPRAIELTYWTESGPVEPPVRLALQLGGVRGR